MQDTINKIGPRRFIESRGFWCLSVKINGKWVTKWKKDEADIIRLEKELHEHLVAHKKEYVLKPTVLSQEEISSCEMSVKFLKQKLGERFTHELIFSAAKRYIESSSYVKTPTLIESIRFFEERCEAVQLADTTKKTYDWMFERLLQRIPPNTFLAEIKKEEVVNFIKSYPIASRRAIIQRMKAYINFCKGEKNPHIQFDDEKWINWNTKDWYIKPTSRVAIRVLRYDEVLQTLKACFYRTWITNSHRSDTLYETNQLTCKTSVDHIGYYIWRIFTMCRWSEHIRFFEECPTVFNHPKIHKDLSQIWFDSEVWRKRARTKTHGRRMKDIHPTFRLWLEWMRDSKAVILNKKTSQTEQEITQLPRLNYRERRNILRHSGITYHVHHFKDPVKTAYYAGNSIKMIEDHYLDYDASREDVEAIYALTPAKCFDEGVFPSRNFPFDYKEPKKRKRLEEFESGYE